jgi:hypothetical protein
MVTALLLNVLWPLYVGLAAPTWARHSSLVNVPEQVPVLDGQHAILHDSEEYPAIGAPEFCAHILFNAFS